jgi:ribosomal protein S18 acetylase RimI-like enzyme
MPYLQNPVYQGLTTANAPFALAHGVALRYQPGVIPVAAVPEPTAQALTDLLPLLTPGEEIFLTTGPGQALDLPTGLTLDLTIPGLQMRFTAATPAADPDPRILTLTSADTADMLALKALAFPGYFGPRAPELGLFVGIRDPATNQLIAMAGERVSTFTDRELSAVCTHPAHLGHGHAARLMRAVLRHQHALGANSLLHVVASNTRAISLYHHLGFETTGAISFHKLTRPANPQSLFPNP